QLVREQARAFAQHRRLPDARSPQEQDALAADDDVADDLAGAGDRAAHAHGQAGDAARAVAYRGDAVQRALDSGAVVLAELTDVVGHVLEVRSRDRAVGKQHLAARDARLGLAAQVKHDLEQLTGIGALVQRAREVGGQGPREQLDLLVPAGARPRTTQ